MIQSVGGKADGKTDNTQAIAAAIDTASAKGGGTLRFTAGDYLTGPIVLKSNVRLHLDEGATLKFITDPSRYPVVLTRWEGTECMNYAGLISARDARNISITGKGVIDGQGQAWWGWSKYAGPTTKKLRDMGEADTDPTKRIFGTPEAGLRPCLFEPINCDGIKLEGVTFKNSPFWTIHPIYCNNIAANEITVIGDGPNTDGFDPDSCSKVTIENCVFDTGDDCITIKSGRDRDGRRVGRPCENIIVRNCRFLRGHGTVVIGSEMSGGVRNVLAEDLTADGTDAGVRIKSRLGRGGTVENIVYRRLHLKNIKRYAITIDMLYDVGNNPTVDPNTPDVLPVYRNIVVEDLVCESARTAIVLRGLPQSQIEKVRFENVSIIATEGSDISYAGLKSRNLSVKVEAAP